MGLPGQGPTTRFPLSLLLQVVSQEDLPLPKGATEAGRRQGRAEDVPLPRGWSTGQRGAGSTVAGAEISMRAPSYLVTGGQTQALPPALLAFCNVEPMLGRTAPTQLLLGA